MKNPTISIIIFLFLGVSAFHAWALRIDDSKQEQLDMELLMAVYQENLEKVKLHIDSGANVNARDYLGLTALMYGLYGNSDEIVSYLIDQGAYLNAIDYSGNSILMHALMAGREEFVMVNLPAFGFINNANNEGFTALILAAQSFELEMLEKLYYKGANIHHKANDGTTALMHAAAFGKFFNVDFLAFKGARINQQADDGTTALHLAAWYGQNEVAGLLLDWGADPEITDENGNTPLLSAIYGRQLETTWYLIESGVSLSVKNQQGFTPLSLATSLEDYEITELIVQYDFREPEKADKRTTALAYAYYYRNVKLQKNLIRLGLQPTGLYFSEFGIYQGLDFNGTDMMYHGGVSVFESRYKMLLRLNYLVRFRAQKLLVPRQPNSFYQFHESRNLLSLGLYREFLIDDKAGGLKFGVRPGIEGGYSFASYRGTSLEAPSGFRILPVADIFFHYKSFSFYLGYNYHNTRQNDVSPHRIRTGVEWRFSFLKKPDTRYAPAIR